MAFDWDAFPADDFEKARELARQFYNSIGRVKCPALGNEEITFNAQGFGHILYKPSHSKDEIITRFRLLRHAEAVLTDTRSIVEYRQRRENIYMRKEEVRATHEVDVHYWSLKRLTADGRVKVLVRQIEKRQKHFFSIMGEER